jgi:hypothetical protein
MINWPPKSLRAARAGHHRHRADLRSAFRPGPDLPRAPSGVECGWRAVRPAQVPAGDLAGFSRREIVFTGTSFAPGGVLTGGKVTFVNVPQVFSWATGPPPPSYGHGTWKIGTSSRSMMGLQHQPDAGIISIQFGTGTLGTYPLVGLEVEGPASAPSFLCEYPDPTNACTFRKIS